METALIYTGICIALGISLTFEKYYYREYYIILYIFKEKERRGNIPRHPIPSLSIISVGSQ